MDWLPNYFPVLRASPLPYQLTAPALALLLVFRTEASYSRFEQGRKAWVKIITGTNDLARQVISFVHGSGDELIIRDTLLRYIAAFPVALKCHVIYGSDIADDLQNVIEADDLSLILQSKHRPRYVIQFISQSFQLLKLDNTKIDMLESKMLQLQEGIGVCEQLMGIPIPLSYTRLTSRFLVLWHLTLPIILWDDCHWNVVPATFISAASLFCIEEVGVLIEEPFSMLALDELCAMVLSNIDEAVESEKVIRNRIIAKKRIHEIKHSSNGFNAAVAGCFFAIETVLRPLRAENSPPFTTAMIILASVISSTVSNALLGTQSAFTVPSYDLNSAAELPLYLILGMLCIYEI